jgi:D-alanyl-D-alanine carboxypeptidase
MMNRRQMIALGVGMTAVAGRVRSSIVVAHPAEDPGPYERAFDPLDRFVAQYLRDIGAPGLTLVLADANAVRRVACFGYDDLGGSRLLRSDQLFEIGSITKSFVALCLLQLRDEGKLELARPIESYLPWIRFEPSLGPITLHNLMTHSAGLPDGPLFPADPGIKYRPANPPGSEFHYCNMGWAALGHLIEMLDGRPLGDSIRARIFAPLGMSSSEPVITFESRERMATSYAPLLGDRPYPPRGPLGVAPSIVMTEGAGCIAATAADMGRYLSMLAGRGAIPHGRLVSEEAFRQFSTSHIKAPDFGDDASYGYGVVVDRLEGHLRLRHTGGMVSFASAIQVDLDEGVGAFVSVNAMQGLRPQPVAEYALRLMRACRSGAPLADVPPPDDPFRVAHATDYAGRYTGAAGDALEIQAQGERLFLMHGGTRVALEPAVEPDEAFHAAHPDFARYLVLFTRADAKNPRSAVIEVAHAESWFSRASDLRAREVAVSAEWRSYCGHYRSEDAWLGSVRVVARHGRLWLDGVIPLEAAPGGLFYMRDEARSPEWVRFADPANGRTMRLVVSGADFVRVMTP